MNNSFSRREFVGSIAAGTMLMADQSNNRQAMAAECGDWPQLPPVKIYQVYAGRPGHAWPKPKFDAPAEVATFEKHLAKA
ncbi:MAG: hypothetical protein ACYTA5_00090, partial [Planctomycetota bacterium]